jgi:hypothetical protein
MGVSGQLIATYSVHITVEMPEVLEDVGAGMKE